MNNNQDADPKQLHWPRTLASSFQKLWSFARVRVRRSPRSLRLEESLALGERRFVAIVECQDSRFLIGGAPNCVTLLTTLPRAQSFGEVLSQVRPQGKVQ